MSFARALPTILKVEGGFVDDPADPGGATNFGVTQAVYDAWRSSRGLNVRPVKEIAMAEVEAIYQQRYWLEGRCDRLPWPASLLHFDGAVNHGPVQAAKLLQRAAGVQDDGVIGPQTIAAVSAKLAQVCDDLLWQRLVFYRDLASRRPASLKFLPGWIRRLAQVRDAMRAA